MTKTPKNEAELHEAFDYLYKTYFGELQIEKEEIGDLPSQLEGCGLFIDVGASLGMYTCFANRALENARIIAVEADPDRFRELQNNCEKWQAEGSNEISAVFAAAGDCHQQLEFFKTGSHISGGVFAISERSDSFDKVEVPQIMLDDFYEEGVKTFVKIDVEGAELRVMEGAKRLVESGLSRFTIGIHSWGDKERKKTPMDFLKFVRSQKLAISKSSNNMTANYLFQPSEMGSVALLLNYSRHIPMLLIRQIYRSAVPRSMGRGVEKIFNRVRQSRFNKE